MKAIFPLRSIAGCFALACFSVAVFAGLSADRDTGSILRSAIIALLVGQVVGLVCGWMMSRSFADVLERHARAGAADDAPDPVAAVEAVTPARGVGL